MNLWKIFMCTNANSICKFYFPCLNFFFTELMSPLAMYKITYPARTLWTLWLLLADSALTVGKGKTFWSVDCFFFQHTKTAVTRKPKVEKSIPRCKMDRLSESYKWAIDNIWGRMTHSSEREICLGWSEWESSSPGCTGDMPWWQKLWFQNKRLTFGPKYPNFWVKKAHFRP